MKNAKCSIKISQMLLNYSFFLTIIHWRARVSAALFCYRNNPSDLYIPSIILRWLYTYWYSCSQCGRCDYWEKEDESLLLLLELLLPKVGKIPPCMVDPSKSSAISSAAFIKWTTVCLRSSTLCAVVVLVWDELDDRSWNAKGRARYANGLPCAEGAAINNEFKLICVLLPGPTWCAPCLLMVNVFYKPKRLVHRNEEVFMQQTNQPPINQDSTKVLTVQTLQKSRFLKKKKSSYRLESRMLLRRTRITCSVPIHAERSSSTFLLARAWEGMTKKFLKLNTPYAHV